MNSFFDADMLMTYSGATLAVALITQFFKEIRWLDRLPTRFVSYCTALIIMVGASLAHGRASWSELALVPINAVVVALAANGSFEALGRR